MTDSIDDVEAAAFARVYRGLAFTDRERMAFSNGWSEKASVGAAESKTASPEPQAEHWQIAMAKGWAKLREQKRAIRAEAWELGHNATGPYAENPYAAEPQAAEPPELKPTKADLIATGRVVVLNRAATNIQHGDASTALDELERRIK